MIWIFVFDLFATHPSSLEVLTSSKWCKPRCDRHGFHSSRNAFTARIACHPEISQPKPSFCGGTSLAPLGSGRSQSSRARAVAKALQIISETKHHGKFRKPNGIYEEVDINGPIPKRRPKPACQGSMEHRKALSLADCRFTEPAARRTFRSLPDLRKPNGKRRAAWDSMLASYKVLRQMTKECN